MSSCSAIVSPSESNTAHAKMGCTLCSTLVLAFRRVVRVRPLAGWRRATPGAAARVRANYRAETDVMPALRTGRRCRSRLSWFSSGRTRWGGCRVKPDRKNLVRSLIDRPDTRDPAVWLVGDIRLRIRDDLP